MADKNITYGASSDSQVPIIADKAGDLIKRFYVYVIPNSDEERAFLDTNATTIAYIENIIPVNNGDLILDNENGQYYLEGVSVVIDGQEQRTVPAGTSMSNEKSFQTLTNNRIFTNQPGKIFIATEDVPLDINKFNNKEQSAYFLTNFQKYHDDLEEYKDVLLNDNTLQYTTMVNVESTLNQFNNAHIQFTISTISNDPLITVDQLEKSGIYISLKNSGILFDISVKGISEDGEYQTFDMETNKTMIPIYTTPSKIEERELISYFRWFDYGKASSLFVAKFFENQITIKEFFINALKEINGTSSVNESEYLVELNLITDILTYTYTITSNFIDFERITASDSGSEYGKLDPKQRIGTYINSDKSTRGQYISVLEGNEALRLTENLIIDYETKNPSRKNSSVYDLTKQLLGLLSKYAISSYSTAGGAVEDVEGISPWYLENSTSINIIQQKLDEDGEEIADGPYLVDMEKLKFSLSSKYFDITTESNLPELVKSNISPIKTVSVRNTSTLENVPQNFSANTINPSPLDDTLSNSLMYLGYIPIDYIDSFYSIFNINITSSSIEGPQTFDTESILSEEFPSDVNLFLKEQASIKFGVPTSSVTILSQGTPIDNSSSFDLFSPSNLKSPGSYGITYDQIGNQVELNVEDAAKIAGIEKNISNTYIDYVENNDLIYRYQGPGGGTNRWLSGSFVYRENYRFYQGCTVEISGNFEVPDNFSNAKNVFTKNSWKKHILDKTSSIAESSNSLLVPIYSNNYKISEIREINISSQWFESFVITIGISSYTISAINSDDESIAKQKIIFI